MIPNFAGAEIGESGEAQAIVGSFAASTTQKRTGAYSWKVQGNGTTPNYGTFKKHSTTTGAFSGFNVATNHVFVGFYVDTLPTSGSENIFEFRSAGGLKAMLQITSTGELDLYKPAGLGLTKVADGTTQLQTGQWYTYELTVGTGLSSAYELRIDLATEYSGTDNFGNVNHDNLRLGIGARQGATSPVFYYDDLVVQDDGFPGDSRVSMLTLDGQGTHTAWLYDYTRVDEIPMNSDGDFIAARYAGRKESATCISCDTAGVVADAQLIAVKGNWYTRLLSGSGPSLQYFLRYDSTEEGTTGEDVVTLDYLYRAFVLERAWTRDEIDSLEVVASLYIATGSFARCTMMNACVLWKPAVAAAVRRPRYTPHAGI